MALNRFIRASQLIDWQIQLLNFWQSKDGKAYGRGFLESERHKWSAPRESVPDILSIVMHRQLREASPYYVTEEIEDLIIQAASMRNTMRYSLYPHQLPTPAGFLVFEKQFYMKDIFGEYCGIRAIAWRQEIVGIAHDDGVGMVDLNRDRSAPGVSIAFYTDTRAPHFLEHDTSMAKAVAKEGDRFANWMTRFVLFAHKGMLFGEHDDTGPEEADDINAAWLASNKGPGPELAAAIYRGEVTLTAQLGQVMKEHDRDIFFPHDLFVATVLIMNQKVAGISGLHADRAAMRRAKRAGLTMPHGVNIVTLRKLVERGKLFPDEEEERDVNWTHRWWVSGHWRRQYYPSTQSHEWIYIEPFIKGPENRPLIPKPDVFFLER